MSISFYVHFFIIFFFSIFLSCTEKNIALLISSLDLETITGSGCESEKTEGISIYSILSKAEEGDRFVFDISHGVNIFTEIRDSLSIEFNNGYYTSKLYLRGSSVPEVTPNMELIGNVLQGQSVTFDYIHKFSMTQYFLGETYFYAHKNRWDGPYYWKFRNKN